MPNDDVEGKYHPRHHPRFFNQEDTLEECKMIGAMYVQAIVDGLNESFLIYLIPPQQNYLVQSIIQVMKKFIISCQSNAWRDWS